MARVTCKRGPVAKATSPQFMRGVVLKCQESHGNNPKPDDLFPGRLKWE